MSRRAALQRERPWEPQRVSWKKKALAWFIILLFVVTSALTVVYYLFEG